MNEDRPSDPAPLDYARPPAYPSRPLLGAFVAVLASFLGLFGVAMFLGGIVALPHILSHPNSVDFAGDVFGDALFLLIGVIGVFAAIRWLRKVPRLFSGG